MLRIASSFRSMASADNQRPKSITLCYSNAKPVARQFGRGANLFCDTESLGNAEIRCKSSRIQSLSPGQDKEIIFIRHGVTEMNEHLSKEGKAWGSLDFVDPGLFDTRLTSRGVSQAKRLGQNFLRDDPGVSLLCCSPLTRALETATHAFAGGQVSQSKRTVVSPLCAERLYLSSDVGRPAAQLTVDFPSFSFNELDSHQAWWYQPEDSSAVDEWRPRGTYLCPGEPEAAFEARLVMFREWLLEQPEDRIAVVSHWGVIRALTGQSLENCEVLRVDLSTILDRPLLVAI